VEIDTQTQSVLISILPVGLGPTFGDTLCELCFTYYAWECCSLEVDTTFWPPSTRLAFALADATTFLPQFVKGRYHVSPWYWKPSYTDYAPSGMPDFDQKQDNWVSIETNQWTFCGPVAVANCFWWFDSKYNVPAGVPGDAWDMFPLVRDYEDNLPPAGPWLQDDHDMWNVDHVNTPWGVGVGLPPSTSQPFVPGPQFPGGGLPPWGELVERLAWYLDTDGVRTGNSVIGTNVDSLYAGIQRWFLSETYEDGSTLADTLSVEITPAPAFAYVESLVEKSEDVILLLGFWYWDELDWWRVGGHYVTVAGVNSDDSSIAISDPFVDWAELGNPGRVLNGSYIPHTHPLHAPTEHNDAGNISHDIYHAEPSISPGGVWALRDYPASLEPQLWMGNFYAQNVPEEFIPYTQPWWGLPIYTEVEYAVHISPWDYRGDVNANGVIELGDVVFLINYLYHGGNPPEPYSEGDVNCDGIIDLGDVVFLINYLFKGGDVPRCCDS